MWDFVYVRRAEQRLRHPDGTPVYRVEETKPLLGSSRAPRMEAEPKQRKWNETDDPVNHCRGRPISAPLEHSWPAGTGTSSRTTCAQTPA